MAAAHYDSPSDTHSYMMSPDLTPGLYDGTSGESSAGSPLNCNAGFENIYGSNTMLQYPAFSTHYPIHHEGFAPMGLIPVELDIEGLYEDHDRRRRKNSSEKTVSSHVHSRRRAQNRASQRAFRDRKEKHMKDLESRLAELEGRHSDLTKSYDSLQLEYLSVKQELERLKKERSGQDEAESHRSPDDWGLCRGGETVDPLLFDVSSFCYDHGDHDERK